MADGDIEQDTEDEKGDVFALTIPDVPGKEQVDVKALVKEYSDAISALTKKMGEVTATKFKPVLKVKNDPAGMMHILIATSSLQPLITRLLEATKGLQDAVTPTVAVAHEHSGMDESVVKLSIEKRPDPGINVVDLDGLVVGGCISAPQRDALSNMAVNGWIVPAGINRVMPSGDAANLISRIKTKRILIGRKRTVVVQATDEEEEEGPAMAD